MQILVENATSRVIGIFADTDTITLESNRVVTPTAVYGTLSSSTATVYTGVTPPTDDNGRYTYDGSTFTDTWPFTELTKVEFLEHLQAEGLVSDADLVAVSKDANLEMFWLKFQMAGGIQRDHVFTTAGLSALVTAGYLDQAGKDAVLAKWPRGRDDGAA